MATVSQWTPYGVSLNITANAGTVTRVSASQYTVTLSVSWQVYWSGNSTNYGMEASAGGNTVTINPSGTYASSGSGSLTGTFSVSGYGASTQTVAVTFTNFITDWQGNVTSSASKVVNVSVSVPALPSYTVSYNANGGSGAPAAQTKWQNISLTLSSTTPTRSNYKFLGWSTSSSASSPSYYAGGTYTGNSSMTLYAVWQLNAYYLDLNGVLDGSSVGNIAGYGTADVYVNGSLQSGGCTDYYSQHTSGSSYQITNIKATTGHTYNGVYSGSLTGSIGSSDVSVYLSFSTNKYTISYNANGGSGAPSSQTKTYGVALTLSSTKPTRTGHSFLGWSTSSSATSASYAAGSTFTANSNTTLYAVWKANTYTVSYNANGGSGAPSAQTKTYGVALTLSSTKPTRTGYTFKAWGTSASATSGVAPGSSYTSNASITYYAIWTPWTHTVAFNTNGGTGSFTSLTKTTNVTLTLPTTVPTKSGAFFAYWNTAKDGSGTKYNAGATYTHTQNGGTVTLYAIWVSSDIMFKSSGNVESGQIVEKDIKYISFKDSGEIEAPIFTEKTASLVTKSISFSSGTIQAIEFVEKEI